MTPRNPLAIAVFAGSLTMAMGATTTASAAEGFIEGSSLGLNVRNFYHNRDFQGDVAKSKAEEWTQSFNLNFQSGYTAGPVGFGVDAMGMLAIKLDGGDGTTGTGLLPAHSPNDFGRLAVAAKAKFSKTELKVGEWQAVVPVLRADDGRSIPQTLQGAQITSKEIDGLTLAGGQFRQNSTRDNASMEDMSFGGGTSDRFNFIGGEYSFNGDKTKVGLWGAELVDVYNQQYVNLVHYQPVGDWLLGANLGYFQGDEDGSEKAGELDNKSYSGMFSAKIGSNTFYVGLQKIDGTQWMRVNGTSGGSIANDSFNSAYDLANERSWQVRHDFNFTAMGVPGLTLMNRYISGDNIETDTSDNGKEWGRESELAYTVQSGALKSLNVKWRNSTMRRSSGVANGDYNENRLIINYPISIL